LSATLKKNIVMSLYVVKVLDLKLKEQQMNQKTTISSTKIKNKMKRKYRLV
jgi:hypothetical protein